MVRARIVGDREASPVIFTSVRTNLDGRKLTRVREDEATESAGAVRARPRWFGAGQGGQVCLHAARMYREN